MPIEDQEARGVSARGGESADGSRAVSLRLRLGPSDARYADGMVAGAKVLELFGDLATEIAIRESGIEGLCAAYDSVEFLEPVRAGDYVEARAWVARVGETSRTIEATLHRVIASHGDGTASVLAPARVCARAQGTLVIKPGPTRERGSTG